jgi:hypothetical protein
MRSMPPKVRVLFFVLFILFTYYCYFYQVRQNTKYYQKLEGKIQKAHSFAIPHPLLISRYDTHIPYMIAYAKIMRSHACRFWIVADNIDPTINLNYFIYPKELRMSVDTQIALILKTLARREDAIQHAPPKNYERVVIVEANSAEVTEQWDRSR